MWQALVNPKRADILPPWKFLTCMQLSSRIFSKAEAKKVKRLSLTGRQPFYIQTYQLKHIIPNAHIIQTAYAWVTKGSGVILIGEVGSAQFNKAFDLWQTIANLCIERAKRFHLTGTKRSFPQHFILPAIQNIKAPVAAIHFFITERNVEANFRGIEEGYQTCVNIIQLIA